MATELGEITSYKRLYMQFRDSIGKTINITLNNPKNLVDGDYVDLAARKLLLMELWILLSLKTSSIIMVMT